jgi:hypothetical protein
MRLERDGDFLYFRWADASAYEKNKFEGAPFVKRRIARALQGADFAPAKFRFFGYARFELRDIVVEGVLADRAVPPADG